MEYSDILQELPKQFFASLVQKVNKAVNEGRDVINLGQGNPDQPTPKAIIEALQHSATQPSSHRYSPFRGKNNLKKAITQFYHTNYGVTLDPEKEVAILFGGKSGLVELPICLCNEGDVVLAPDPGYPDYLSGIALSKAVPYFMPLKIENDFLPVYDTIPNHIKAAAKLMFLNYPNNPTGAGATKEFFDETISFAKQNEIVVAHDFAYGAIGFNGEQAPSFLQSKGAKEVGIEIYTFSKTFNMAGWRIAFAVGNEKIIEAINLLQDHLYVSIFPAIQDAAAQALQNGNEDIRRLVELYEDRKNAFVLKAKSIGWNAYSPKGSFFVWLPVPKGYTSETFSDYLLDNANVAVAAGIGFGEHGEGFVRVGLVESKDRLLEAIDRIAQCQLF